MSSRCSCKLLAQLAFFSIGSILDLKCPLSIRCSLTLSFVPLTLHPLCMSHQRSRDAGGYSKHHEEDDDRWTRWDGTL